MLRAIARRRRRDERENHLQPRSEVCGGVPKNEDEAPMRERERRASSHKCPLSYIDVSPCSQHSNGGPSSFFLFVPKPSWSSMTGFFRSAMSGGPPYCLNHKPPLFFSSFPRVFSQRQSAQGYLSVQYIFFVRLDHLCNPL